MRASVFLVAASFVSVASAGAQDFSDTFEFFGESRLRLETADEANLPEDAVGLTQLIRPALEVRATPRLTGLIEGEALFALVDDFNDGTGNEPDRPLILDPDGLELNRLQLQYAFTPQTFLTVGRQKIGIDDQRFLGPAAFRQNDQTVDAVHFASRSFGTATFQAGYFNRVNRILGADNPIGRFRGDSYYFNVNIPTPLGRVGAFHYAFDLGTASPTDQDNVFSSRTSGFRLDGRLHRDTYGIDWEASYARQTDFADNPFSYNTDYWLLGLQSFAGPARLSVRFESLGADAEQSFQTPLGTLHRFQGEADIFLITPPDGLEDLEIRGSWNFGRVGVFRNISTALSYHRFEAETGGARFGDEIDFQMTAAVGPFTIAFTTAYYDADTFATDTRRFFLSLTHRF
ncbi:MAG: hypothetical protein AAF292_17380 [Pseudomonadota bacterium]